MAGSPVKRESPDGADSPGRKDAQRNRRRTHMRSLRWREKQEAKECEQR
jgi:hypothetical protein